MASGSSSFNCKQHLDNCMLLGELLRHRPDLTAYARKYFDSHPSPFLDEEPKASKKRRKENDMSDLRLVEACYFLQKIDKNMFRNRWNWSDFIRTYLKHKDVSVKWLSCHCVAKLTGMNEGLLQLFIQTMNIPIDVDMKLTYNFDQNSTLLPVQPNLNLPDELIGEVVDISGIKVPKLSHNELSQDNMLVLVESTKLNLKKIALGLCANKAVCLQGPVGCGKTSLVEYMALKTGRILGKNFIKVQLGDQTESKMLLGSFRCTDIPGEFVWQAGVVTQAVTEGHWLLLEDIDAVSTDIASVLSSLLENGTLTVPGFRDNVAIAPGFQLFLTQRLASTTLGLHKKHSGAMALLDKHLLQITIDPLSTDELEEIVGTLYPQFKPIATRMLDVFRRFTKNPEESIRQRYELPKTSRLISTRDFFKLCFRAAANYESMPEQKKGLNKDFRMLVYQNSIDVLGCSFPRSKTAYEAIAVDLGMSTFSETSKFYFDTYKPEDNLSDDHLSVGRAIIKRNKILTVRDSKFFFTRPSSILLERIMCCVNFNEPVLLVGETGTGKTSSIQYLADVVGQKLIVINMNQQSDSADLLGGFKPVDMKFVMEPIRAEYVHVFSDTFLPAENEEFLRRFSETFNKQKWSKLVKTMKQTYEKALKNISEKVRNSNYKGDKLKRAMRLQQRWRQLGKKLHKVGLQIRQGNTLAFSFIEGSLVKAIKNGHWVLLDEINLANAETLECLSGLLEGSKGSLCLLERGDTVPVQRHKDFTLFACMNPSTDVGKKDLPPGLRNRFTELYVDDITEQKDLILLVENYLNSSSLKTETISKIVKFYVDIRKMAKKELSDGLRHTPHYSLRSLCRALVITSKNPCGMFKRSLFEAFCLSFLTQLDEESYIKVQKMIGRVLIGDAELKSILNQPIRAPKPTGYVEVEGYWVHKGDLECAAPEDYILTKSVKRNLKDLVRVVSIGGLPVLLQGDTSVGKTSLITYLAKFSGNKCVRINNHEHTDLQEYIGSYVADADGKLVFREGLLVEAMRKGYWIILDELNLAPTDVLEALNRVLDDNRELYIPETQKTIKANVNFMLFATQNPPGSYGGRKMLSRAFRNRFVELHFNEIPHDELEVILQERCKMARSHATKMINVMKELQRRRRSSTTFAGKHGFITLRDLFRWGERHRKAPEVTGLYDWDQHLADEGYLVLAGRVRRPEEKQEIAEVLQKHLKRTVEPRNLFTLSDKTSPVTKNILEKICANTSKGIVWTFNMRQLAVMVAKAFQFKEPVLLVGETGGGKTTVCQIAAEQNGQKLMTINCHMQTESSDFIGGLRPVRDHVDSNKLFEWVNGPLIQAMVEGSVFLADEISLADDSVLERLNSLLEPERTLLLAEKGTDINNRDNCELIQAHPDFCFIGTMNPGGDYGKKELSPALRNRFTEIWCDSCTDRDDLVAIIERNVKTGISFGNQQDSSSGIGNNIMDFVEWFKKTEVGKRITVSIRDILTWVAFINTCGEAIDIYDVYLHGACLTFLDGLGSGVTGTENMKILQSFKDDCLKFLVKQTRTSVSSLHSIHNTQYKDRSFGIEPFFIEVGELGRLEQNFSFDAPTTCFNALRLLRGMQLNKAILLEGSPGVGKTSLVMALAKCTGHNIFRVNLSDQTDISDLFGADLPVEGGTGGQFSWRDGPLLQALKQGHWILLDELNLASQSVLEGLNACLDHRGEIFIPELDKTFRVKPGTRFFACQNPLKQGGSRRGLPRSFLNRFIQVYVNPLTFDDLEVILRTQFPDLPFELLSKMLKFNSAIVAELESYSFGHKGAPWEFNLRDLTRWCEAVTYHYQTSKEYRPENLVELIYVDRMRTLNDKNKMREIFSEVFGKEVSGGAPVFYANSSEVYIGDVVLSRAACGEIIDRDKGGLVLRSQLPALRSLAYCVNLNWMSILVGSSGSGKSAVVRVLADLRGKTLRTLPVTSAMDTADILGGFEQSGQLSDAAFQSSWTERTSRFKKTLQFFMHRLQNPLVIRGAGYFDLSLETDYARHLEEVAKETEVLLLHTVQVQLAKHGRLDAASTLLAFWERYCDETSSNSRTMEEEVKLFLKKLECLKDVWNHIEEFIEDKNKLEVLRGKAEVMIENAKREGSLNAGGKFEWVDSVLIKCLQEGSWLLVDNVNLCSAAILDRLNALLEPSGVLTVSERGVDADGRMYEIKPHRDFRLFLTMDPKNGEISRAMRNRGVEIYMLTEKESESRNDYDVRALVRRAGLDDSHQINALITLHDFVTDLVLGEKPNINDLIRASALISQQIHHGISITDAFEDTITEVYYKTRNQNEFSCVDFLSEIKEEITQSLQLDPPYFSDDLTITSEHLHTSTSLQLVKQQGSLLKLESEANIRRLLLVHFYALATASDLNSRYCHVKDGAELFEYLKRVALGDFPLDLKWYPEIAKSKNNCWTLALHFVSLSEIERKTSAALEQKLKKTDQVSMFKYMQLKRERKVDDQFNSCLLVDNLLDLIESYDACVLEKLEKNDVTDTVAVKILYLLSWRFILQRSTLVNIKGVAKNLLLSNLKVHYRWFSKRAIHELKLEPLPERLEVMVEAINRDLEQHFSDLHAVAKRYQKVEMKPPPRTRSVTEGIELTSADLTITDHFVQLNTKKSFSSIFEAECTSVSLLPSNLAGALSEYSRDPSLIHEISKVFYGYVSSNIASPTLTRLVTDVIAAEASFGNFRKLTEKQRFCRLTLWRNVKQLHDDHYDFVQLERKFILDSFQLFMQQMRESLSTDDVIASLEQVLKQENCFIAEYILECEKLIVTEPTIEDVTLVHVELAYVKAVLNSKLPLIDPSTKKTLKKQYNSEHIQSFEDLKRTFSMLNEVYNGSEASLHSHYHHVTTLIADLKLKQEKLENYVAIRPKDITYEEVLTVVSDAFSTVLNPIAITATISNLRKALRASDEIPEEFFAQYDSLILSIENMIQAWVRYLSYPDIIAPVLGNLAEFLYGLKMAMVLIKKSNWELKYGVKEEITGLIQMQQFSSGNLDDFIGVCEEHPNDKKREVLRLLKCDIQEAFNGCLLGGKPSGVLDRTAFRHFERLMKMFINAWNSQEKEREAKEKEAESLYKTKTKCEELPEEEQMAEEMKQLFPNFHDQDFADMQKPQSVGDDPADEDVKENAEVSGVITSDDVKFVSDIHVTLLRTLTKCEWLNPDKDKTVVPDLISPLMEKFKTFKKILDKNAQYLDYTLDTESLGSLNVLLHVVQNYGDLSGFSEHPSSPSRDAFKKPYDFYKDSNVEEVKSSFHILEELRLRVVELLEQWPGQATLQSILTIIERIYGFNITSPLPRFLTGFEILLAKCKEWEEVAHSGVSLSTHFQNMTHQIISWRKEELKVWKTLMNSTFQRLSDCSKWWFYIYNVMDQFVTEQNLNDVELIETMQKFMTSSNLVEFESRLQLLHTFHCHAIYLSNGDKAKTFSNVLWNLCCYFRQFSRIVKKRIEDLRAPIEKKLKDYVKIVRWNDINYWAVKSTVEKSHKTLHKYVKEFQDALKQGVMSCLINTSPDFNKVESVGIWDRPQRSPVKTYHYVLDVSTYLVKDSAKKVTETEEDNEVSVKNVQKMNLCLKKSKRWSKETIVKVQYPDLIQALDSFITEVIESCNHLQGLEVDRTLPKDKQKSHAKNIQQQKHRALADLFKVLSKMGLSFRTGIVTSKLKAAAEDFLLRPIDISANFSHIDHNRRDEKILTIWEKCEEYYLRALMRADVLDTALKKPAPDLGLPNIERCRGFSSHLLSLTQEQKSELIETSRHFCYLRYYTARLTELCEDKHFVPLKAVVAAQSAVKDTMATLEQLNIVVQSCPPAEEFGSETQSVPVLKPTPANFFASKNDETWVKTRDLIKSAMDVSNKILQSLQKGRGTIPCVDYKLKVPKFVAVPDLENDFQALHKSIEDLEAIFGNVVFARNLALVKENFSAAINAVRTDTAPQVANEGKVQSRVVALTNKLGKVLKNVFEKYSVPKEGNEEDKEQDESIKDEHLRLGIIKNLSEDLKCLDLKSVLDLTDKLASAVFVLEPSQCADTMTFVSHCIPILEQAVLLYQYFVTQQVSAYRLTCKMSSVLLNIFIELTSKGFCVPPELSDEMEGEGQSSDGLGLGEGKGERDVSDKIESEDQLEDAQPADQEKQKDDEEDCKEEEKGIEMSEDFEGKLQDVDKKPDDESDEEDADSDAEQQMGDTEKGADALDEEVWGSDDEKEEEDAEQKEEQGKSGEKDGEDHLAAKEDETKKQKDSDGPEEKNEREEQQTKEINEMEEPEFDEEQTDPYHGKQPELPEPEPMDLPDDLQLDDGEEKDEQQEENPFDIDATKEENPPLEKEMEVDEDNEKERDDQNEHSSDDEEITQNEDNADATQEESEDQNEDAKKIDENEEAKGADNDDNEEGTEEKTEESGLDQTQTNQDHVEAMEVDETQASDKTQSNQAENQKSNQPIDELCQEDRPDQEGVGQSQMEESTSGHSTQTSVPQEAQSKKREREDDLKGEKRQKPGDSDTQRSLGDVDAPVQKKLKTVDESESMSGGEDDDQDHEDADIFQHIKDAKETTKTQILDAATKEQAEAQKQDIQEEDTNEEEVLPMVEDDDEETKDVAEPQKAEKLEAKSERKKSDKKQHPEGEAMEEIQDVEIEGDFVQTSGPDRGGDCFYQTMYDSLAGNVAAKLTDEEISSLRSEVGQQLSNWNQMPTDSEADRAWQKITSVTSSLAQDLSEQLRLILEPTQASHLKGDFRTGRRINMRKVIPYIASQFRKDKIWLRRTKPSKREYQIVLAIDDSKSMADNEAKELAFESCALISKALSLLESGQLSILSFGSKTEVIHKFSDQFTDNSGVKVLQNFLFDQDDTKYDSMVNFATEMFAQSHSQSQAPNAKLLIVISDGCRASGPRVRQAERRARLAGIFIIFIIVDNPKNKASVFDTQNVRFEGKKAIITNAMDEFPFPFYQVLRNLNSLPNVLSDALRDWFEKVSSLDGH